MTAGVVWPVVSSPIRDGAILIDDAGRIVAVGAAATLPAPTRVPSLGFPDAVLLPGLVNAHTHLELHGLRGVAMETDFFEWLQHVRKLKSATARREFQRAARAGLRECWRHGTTTVADTGTTDATPAALAELGGRGTYYHEVIAPEPERAEEALGEARAALRRLAARSGPAVRLGLSPHAPYTVSPILITSVARSAREAGFPLAAHVAESAAEATFVTEGDGPFGELWRRRRIPRPEAAGSPVRYMERCGLLGPDLLAIHVVQADDADLALLAQRNTAVASCPRSNRRHGHGDPPLAAMLRAGLRVGLGTDSVASVDALDLLAEAREACAIAGCSAERALRLVTVEGAAAIGWEADVGSLEPGKWADACAMRLGDLPTDPERLADAVLRAGSAGVAATLVGGRCVYEASGYSSLGQPMFRC